MITLNWRINEMYDDLKKSFFETQGHISLDTLIKQYHLDYYELIPVPVSNIHDLGIMTLELLSYDIEHDQDTIFKITLIEEERLNRCVSCNAIIEYDDENGETQDFDDYAQEAQYVDGCEFSHIEGKEGRLCYGCYERLNECPVQILGYHNNLKLKVIYDDPILWDIAYRNVEIVGEERDPQDNLFWQPAIGIYQDWILDICKHVSYIKTDALRGNYEVENTKLVAEIQYMCHLWGDSTAEFNKNFAD